MATTSANQVTTSMTVSLQSAIQPLFWGAIALAALVPVATAAGVAVGTKVFGNAGK